MRQLYKMEDFYRQTEGGAKKLKEWINAGRDTLGEGIS